MADSVREHMLADHTRLDDAIDRLKSAVDGADALGLRREWEVLEQGVRAHFAFEEEALFPLLPDKEVETVQSLQAEHTAIRTQLEEIGVQVELHTLRKETADRLAEALAEHAAREERLLYDVADEASGVLGRASLIERLRLALERRRPGR